MPREYVVDGATLVCNMSHTSSRLIVLPTRSILLRRKFKANIGDCIPMVNVMPFGLCRSLTNPAVASATAAANGRLTPRPCTPRCRIWIGGKTDVLIEGMPALLSGDKAVCPLGAGTIEVRQSGQ